MDALFTDPTSNIEELGIYEGMTVVDFGAGTGAYIVPLGKSVGETGHIYAIEIQKEFLQNIKDIARENGFKNVEVIWGDIERLGGTKLKDASADVVIISNVLFQAEDKAGAIREARRILKEGGRLLIVDWKESFNNLGPEEGAVFSKEQAKKLVEAEGLSVKKEFSAGEHHYGLVVLKL